MKREDRIEQARRRCKTPGGNPSATDRLLVKQENEIRQLRVALEHPPTSTHTPDWEVVSAVGGPRQRCQTCGWLGLPVESV